MEQFCNPSTYSFNSTAKSSATSEYGTFPERIGQKEEPTSRNEERTMNTPSSRVQIFERAQQAHTYILNMKSWIILYWSYLILWNFLKFSNYGKSFNFFCWN